MKIILKKSPLEGDQPSFGSYCPQTKTITVSVGNRNFMDILRSLAHEMVHYKQDLEGRLYPGAGDTGSDIENEANAIAGQIMRWYAQENPQYFKLAHVTEEKALTSAKRNQSRKRSHPEQHKAVEHLFKKIRKFVETPASKPEAQQWVQQQMQQRQMKENINILFENFSQREFGTTPVRSVKSKIKIKKKKLSSEETPDKDANGIETILPVDAIGTTINGPKGTAYIQPFWEATQTWKNNPKTIAKFKSRYGERAELKLFEAVSKLEKIKIKKNIRPKTISQLLQNFQKR